MSKGLAEMEFCKCGSHKLEGYGIRCVTVYGAYGHKRSRAKEQYTNSASGWESVR